MTNITDVIKDDAEELGLFAKGLGKSLWRAVYFTPCLNTSCKQLVETFKGNQSEPEKYGRLYAQALGGIVAYAVSINYAIKYGRVAEYFALLTITNIADYLWNAHKRAKELKNEAEN